MFHNPKNEYPLHHVFVVVSRDEEGNEGIFAESRNGYYFPFLTGDSQLAQTLFKRAKELNQGQGTKTIHLIEFDRVKS